jgi:lipopolysaccharide export LptBFGC system permease protein LptF
MSTWKAVFAALIIFVMGTVFGLAVSFWIAPNVSAYAQPAQEILTHRLNQRLARNLSLSAEQKEAIDGIIEDARSCWKSGRRLGPGYVGSS